MDPLVIVASMFGLLYAAVRLLVPVAPRLSAFELKRRLGQDDDVAMVDDARRISYDLLQAVRGGLLVVLLTATAVTLAGISNGFVTVLTVVAGVLAVEWLHQIRAIASLSARLYGRIEPTLLRLKKHKRFLFFLPTEPSVSPVPSIASEDELLSVIDGSKFLSRDRRDLIRSALEFTGLTARDAMSGRRSIKAIDKGEILGPLLLDELYRTGKGAFVVTDGSVDDIVGILGLEKLTSLDLRDTPTALKAMNPDVHYIDHDDPVTDALAYLRSSKAPFLVVRDDDGATVGLLTMDNVLRCLFTD